MGCETSLLLLLFTHINRLNRYWQLHAGCFHFCSAEKGWHKINPHVDLIGQHQPFFFFNSLIAAASLLEQTINSLCGTFILSSSYSQCFCCQDVHLLQTPQESFQV